MTKKRESNAFANIMGVGQPAPAAPAVEVSVAQVPGEAVESVKRGRGRPRARSEPPQTTTIRLSAENHRKIRMLALRDGMSMTGLIFAALQSHCETRGVKLEKELLK